MKKLETLLQLTTSNYDTPKKLNRSDKPIWQETIRQFENGQVTCEMLEVIAQHFPVFRYKTCITIHGIFAMQQIPLVGGYKSLIRNANGSLEVRYNAIDLEKKKQISDVLKKIDSKWRFCRDSQNTSFQIAQSIDGKHDAENVIATFKETARNIQQIEFYGKTSVFLARMPWGGIYAVLDVIMDALPESSVKPFTLLFAGISESEIAAKVAAYDQKASEDAARWEKEKADRDAWNNRIQAKRDALDKLIADKPRFQIEIGSRGIKTVIANGKIPAYKIIEIVSKGSFGRYKARNAYVGSLDDLASLTDDRYKPGRKELKAIEIAGYRQL